MAHRPTRLPEARAVQVVIEWRYPRAHRYWDDCGKVISAVEAAFPGLTCEALREDGFTFAGSSGPVGGARFYWDRAHVELSRDDSDLSGAAARFLSVIMDGLGVASFMRLGHRTYMVFETESVPDASRWLAGHQLWQFAKQAEFLGAPSAAGVILRTRLEPGGRRMRMEVNAGAMSTRHGKTKKDWQGVIVDIDLVIESPDVVPENPREFLDDNRRLLRDVQSLFRGKQ